ncbi:Uncharacterised protein [Mycobacteroides abscessus subsp. abscessus]|nr:Uncharacterised protein [Mycobacteroides abscessus subsp. abscessus]
MAIDTMVANRSMTGSPDSLLHFLKSAPAPAPESRLS